MKIDCDFRVKAFRPRKIILNVKTEEEKKELIDIFNYIEDTYDKDYDINIIHSIQRYLRED